MNRRTRRSSQNTNSTYLRYLKPGALAQIRDSRINAKTHRPDPNSIQISLLGTPSPLSSPPRSPNSVQIDGLPFFSGMIYGPRCPQRKKLSAAKSVFFINSGTPGPVSDSPNQIIDLFSIGVLVGH